MRITSKGQVTIPQAIREQVGFLPDTEVDFVVEEGAVMIVKAAAPKRLTRGASAVRMLRDNGRRVSMSTDEIMAMTRSDD